MGALKIEFEQTTLSQVLSAVKSGQIEQQGDAAENVYWLCYTAASDENQFRVWIEASGEMGGPEDRITNIAVKGIANEHPTPDCPTLPRQFDVLSFNNGIWLGTSETAVQHAFRSGLLRRGDQAFIGYHGKVPDNGNCEGGYDLLNSLYITFQGGVVTAVDAGQVTSC